MDPNSKKANVNVETILGCGCFQAFVFLSLQWCSFVQSCNMLFMIFGKVVPTQWACMDDGNTINFNDSSQCDLVNSGGCKNFTWSGPFHSIVPHWQLVCDRVKYVYLIMTLQMLGGMLGSPIFGHTSDSFGRKWTLMASLVMMIASGAATAISPNWQTFAALMFIMGFSTSGCIITNQVYVMEFLTRKHRLWVSNIADWIISYSLLVAIAYATADWRKMTIIINTLGIPAIFIVWWLGESPRWLLQKGRIAEAEIQLKRIARFNGRTLDEENIQFVLRDGKAIVQDLPIEESEKIVASPSPILGSVSKPAILQSGWIKNYTYWHLFATKKLSIHLIVLSITYFCISVVSAGITFNADNLAGNLYANVAMMGVLRWCSNLITVAADLLIKSFGRRLGLIVPFIGIFMCTLTVTLVYVMAPGIASLKTIIVIISMTATFLCPPIWIMVYLCNAELFPTPIRNMSHAFCATFNRLGGVVAPQVLYLAYFWTPAPYAIFAGLALIASILFALFIPETKGKRLPEKMPERRNSHGHLLTHLRRRSKSSISRELKLDQMSYNLVDNLGDLKNKS